jgi:hypothetical protein
VDREKIDFKDFSSKFSFTDLEKFENLQYFIWCFYMVKNRFFIGTDYSGMVHFVFGNSKS